MKEQLEAIRSAAKQALADCADSKLLENLRVQYLGKKGELTAILKQMGKLSAEERPAMGQLANQVRSDIEKLLADKQQRLAEAALAHKLAAETDHRGKRNSGDLSGHGLFCGRRSGGRIRLL